jgi:biopolymer transport protein ExbD
MAMGGGLKQQDTVLSEINMTPLVDVMLVLLIVFMITVPVLTHAVKLDLPQASNQANKVSTQTVTLSITRDGKTHWNQEVVSQSELDARLLAAAKQQPQPELQIRGDRLVAYQYVASTMAAVQRAGILHLGFITEPGDAR